MKLVLWTLFACLIIFWCQLPLYGLIILISLGGFLIFPESVLNFIDNKELEVSVLDLDKRKSCKFCFDLRKKKLLFKKMKQAYPRIQFYCRKDVPTCGGHDPETGQVMVNINFQELSFTNVDQFKFVVMHEIAHVRFGHSKLRVVLRYCGVCLFVLAPFLVPMYWLFVSFVQKKQEYIADAFAAKKTSVVYGISCFRKVMLLTKNKRSGLFDSHPSDAQRIKALQRLTGAPS